MDVDDHPNNVRRFFKIIFEPNGDLQKLGIPKLFMAVHGSDLLDLVSLQIPTGKTWKVKLVKENGRAWFGDGWPEIVSYCSICHGHFLVFTYRGKSQFDLYIFDKTTCEIDQYDPFDSQEPREVQRRVPETKTKATNHTAPNSSSKENGMLALVRLYRRKFGVVTPKDIKKINSYQFEIPSFTVIMHPSYVTDSANKFRLRLPLKIAADYFTNTRGMSCTLQNATGDTWPIRYNGSSPRLMNFFSGWKKFAIDNKLCVDDICVFELVNADDCLFKVEILRHSSPESSVDVGVCSWSEYPPTRSPGVEREVILIDD